jgi:hypothetical protein
MTRFFALDDFMELSSSGPPYVWMCTMLLPCVVGKKAWGKQHLKEPLSDIVTCCDETFVLLVLDNNYVHWLAEAKWVVNNQDKAVDEHKPKLLPECKYTNSERSKKNGRSRRLSGWAQEGYIKSNTMYTLVAEDRLRCANFETELMTTWRNCQPVAKVIHKDDKDKDELFPANDLEGLAQHPTHCERKATRTNTYTMTTMKRMTIMIPILNRHFSSRSGL